MKKLNTLTFLVVQVLLSVNASSQTQMGGNITYGANTELGKAVSMSADGQRIAIGAPFTSSPNAWGSAHMYQWNGTAWTQMGTLVQGEATGDECGRAVAMNADGSTVIIGGPGNGNTGHARVYDWNGTAWVQRGVDIDGEQVTGSTFGWSVDISNDGNTVVVGDQTNDGINGSTSGSVRVFEWSGTAWVQKGTDVDGSTANERFGWAVSMSADGSKFVASSPWYTSNGLGKLTTYNWNGTGWVQQGGSQYGEDVGDNWGESVSMSADGNTIAWGSQYNTGGPGSSPGSVEVYNWNGSAWVQMGIDIDGEAASDYSGISCSLDADGNTIAIGARGNDGGGTSTGHCRIWKWNGTAWYLPYNDINGTGSLESGTSVSLNASGTRVVVGAPVGSIPQARAYQICNPTTSTFTHSACGSYTWIDGNTYTTSTNTPTYSMENATGCDSVITLNLTISNNSTSSISPIVCNTYTAPGGQVYNSSGSYTATIPNASGCDSVITINLTVHHNSSSTISPNACGSYIGPNGITYTNSGTFTISIPNAAGCDSVITMNLSVTNVNNNVSVSGNTLIASAASGSYQWLDCNNGYAVITGQNSQSFTPLSSGNYAVAVTQGGCTDTSVCMSINVVGIHEQPSVNQILLLPNPVTDMFRIQLGSNAEDITVTILDECGRIVAQHHFEDMSVASMMSPERSGIYIVQITGKSIGTVIRRLVKVN